MKTWQYFDHVQVSTPQPTPRAGDKALPVHDQLCLLVAASSGLCLWLQDYDIDSKWWAGASPYEGKTTSVMTTHRYCSVMLATVSG
jgi:hypothetical protein